jgi:hypothetical protein
MDRDNNIVLLYRLHSATFSKSTKELFNVQGVGHSSYTLPNMVHGQALRITTWQRPNLIKISYYNTPCPLEHLTLTRLIPPFGKVPIFTTWGSTEKNCGFEHRRPSPIPYNDQNKKNDVINVGTCETDFKIHVYHHDGLSYEFIFLRVYVNISNSRSLVG